jgi:peptidoglycan/xylan/chitin deacetylase (PgdA/CDA1 family)
MSLSDIVHVHERGHEIADHTFSHLSAHDATVESFLADIDKNQAALKALGLPPSRHFAYPFGHVTPALKQSLSEIFETSRGVVNSKGASQDAHLLNAVRVYSEPDLDIALRKIDSAKISPQWLHLYTHDIRENPSDFGCTPDDFQAIVSAVDKAGFRVMTIDAAYRAIHQGSAQT